MNNNFYDFNNKNYRKIKIHARQEKQIFNTFINRLNIISFSFD